MTALRGFDAAGFGVDFACAAGLPLLFGAAAGRDGTARRRTIGTSATFFFDALFFATAVRFVPLLFFAAAFFAGAAAFFPVVLRVAVFFAEAGVAAARLVVALFAVFFPAVLELFRDAAAFVRRAAVRLAMIESFRNLDSFAISVVLSDAYRKSDGAAEHQLTDRNCGPPDPATRTPALVRTAWDSPEPCVR